MTTTFNPYRRMMIILLALVLFVSVIGMACDGTENPCAGGDACGLVAPAGDLQQTVTDYLQDSCQKDANGYCKTMGE